MLVFVHPRGLSRLFLICLERLAVLTVRHQPVRFVADDPFGFEKVFSLGIYLIQQSVLLVAASRSPFVIEISFDRIFTVLKRLVVLIIALLACYARGHARLWTFIPLLKLCHQLHLLSDDFFNFRAACGMATSAGCPHAIFLSPSSSRYFDDFQQRLHLV